MSNARFSILQARAVEDKRISNAQFRTLAALGTFGDKDGWCFPKVRTIATMLDKSRQAVNADLMALQALGYIEIYHQYWEQGGQKSSKYRLLFDTNTQAVNAPPQAVNAPPQAVNAPGATPELAPGATPELAPGATPELAPINAPINAPNRTPHINSNGEKDHEDFVDLLKGGHSDEEQIFLHNMVEISEMHFKNKTQVRNVLKWRKKYGEARVQNALEYYTMRGLDLDTALARMVSALPKWRDNEDRPGRGIAPAKVDADGGIYV